MMNCSNIEEHFSYQMNDKITVNRQLGSWWDEITTSCREKLFLKALVWASHVVLQSPVVSCCICPALATSIHWCWTSECRRVPYGAEHLAFWIPTRLEVRSRANTVVSLAHVCLFVPAARQGGTVVSGVGPPWTRLCFINKPQKASGCGCHSRWWMGSGCVWALSLRELCRLSSLNPKRKNCNFQDIKSRGKKKFTTRWFAWSKRINNTWYIPK